MISIEMLVWIFVFAFACEFIDTSIGGGYGTIMTPLLMIMGLTKLLIVPSILISETVTGVTAMIFHHEFKNCEMSFKPLNENAKIFLMISLIASIGTIIAVILAIKLPSNFVNMYIGIMVTVLGIIAVTSYTFKYTTKRMGILAGIAGFNKSLSGGGYGPLLTNGQLIFGREGGDSVGIATSTEGPVCAIGLLTYILLNGFFDLTLAITITIAAALSSLPAAYATTIIKKNKKLIKRLVGVLGLILGITVILGALGLMV